MAKSRSSWLYALVSAGLFAACLQGGSATTDDSAASADNAAPSSSAFEPRDFGDCTGPSCEFDPCGDGICGPNETCHQCVEDCGLCVAPDSPGALGDPSRAPAAGSPAGVAR